jgi:hypothetical protein
MDTDSEKEEMVEAEQRKQHFPFAQEILPGLRNLRVLHCRENT